jgi:hypothetical protein
MSWSTYWIYKSKCQGLELSVVTNWIPLPGQVLIYTDGLRLKRINPLIANPSSFCLSDNRPTITDFLAKRCFVTFNAQIFIMKFVEKATFATSCVLLWKSFSMVGAFPPHRQQSYLHIQQGSKPRLCSHIHSTHNTALFNESVEDKDNDAAPIETNHQTHTTKMIPLPLQSPDRLFTFIPVLWLISASPANAVGSFPSALWASAHFVSIIVIFGCLVAEKTLVKAPMTIEEEEMVVRLDLVYGLMVALLYVT